MGNPFFPPAAQQGAPTASGSPPQALIGEFFKFAKATTPQAAEAKINELLTSGQMQRGQFDYLMQAAKQFMAFLR